MGGEGKGRCWRWGWRGLVLRGNGRGGMRKCDDGERAGEGGWQRWEWEVLEVGREGSGVEGMWQRREG